MKAFVLVSVVCLLATAPLSADEAEPNVDPATWKQRNVESKWVVYRRAAADAQSKKSWWTFLAENEDFELLEMIAVYESWRGPGELLLRHGAPQGIRAAVWTLWDVSSHSFEHAAVTVLKNHAAKTLGWLDKYMGKETPLGKAAPIRALRTELEKLKVEPEDPGNALPPLEPRVVFRHLRAPAKLAVVGADVPLKLRDDAVYQHQVVRAIEGHGRSGRHTGESWGALETLLDHEDPVVRRATCLAYSTHGGPIPLRKLLDLIDADEQPDAVREAAVLAFSKLTYPVVRVRMIEIATQTDHPAWRAAVSRLIDTREDFLFEPLSLLMAQSEDADTKSFLVDEVARLAQQVRDPNVFARDAERRLVIATWLQLTGHPLAANYAQWTLARFQKFEKHPKVRSALWTVFGKFDATAWLDGRPELGSGSGSAPSIETVTKMVRAQAERLLKGEPNAGRRPR